MSKEDSQQLFPAWFVLFPVSSNHLLTLSESANSNAITAPHHLAREHKLRGFITSSSSKGAQENADDGVKIAICVTICLQCSADRNAFVAYLGFITIVSVTALQKGMSC